MGEEPRENFIINIENRVNAIVNIFNGKTQMFTNHINCHFCDRRAQNKITKMSSIVSDLLLYHS